MTIHEILSSSEQFCHTGSEGNHGIVLRLSRRRLRHYGPYLMFFMASVMFFLLMSPENRHPLFLALPLENENFGIFSIFNFRGNIRNRSKSPMGFVRPNDVHERSYRMIRRVSHGFWGKTEKKTWNSSSIFRGLRNLTKNSAFQHFFGFPQTGGRYGESFSDSFFNWRNGISAGAAIWDAQVRKDQRIQL